MNPSGQHQQLLHLAVHKVETATAKVPFSCVLLLDHVKRQTIPEGMRVRMVIPSDGLVSVSLWDTPDPGALKEWLDENLGGDCVSEVYEVQEEFTYGCMLEVARARAAERVAGNTSRTIGAISETTSKATAAVTAQLREFDHKTGVITGAKETTATAAKAVTQAVGKVAENPQVQNVVSNVSKGVAAGWSRMTTGAAWLGGQVARQLDNNPGGPDATQVRMDADSGYTPPQGAHYDAVGTHAGGGGGVDDDPLDRLPAVSEPARSEDAPLPPASTPPARPLANEQ